MKSEIFEIASKWPKHELERHVAECGVEFRYYLVLYAMGQLGVEGYSFTQGEVELARICFLDRDNAQEE